MNNRRPRPRRKYEVEPHDGPTPETLAKLYPDPYDRLPHDLKACADAVALAYSLLTAHMGVKAMDPAKFGRAHPRPWKPSEEALIDRYADWVDELSRRRLPLGPIMDVVADRQQPWDVEISRRLPAGKVMGWTIEGLGIYAKMCLTSAR